MFEDRFEQRVVADAQPLDLDLAVLGPVLRNLGGLCGGRSRRDGLFYRVNGNILEVNPIMFLPHWGS